VKKIIISLILIFSFLQVTAQENLNNQSILDLIELGFDESVIVAKIEASTTNFDVSIDKLKELKNKGTSKSILIAMIKSSKKIKSGIDKANISLPKINDTEFNWEDGYGIKRKVDFRVSDSTGLKGVFIGKYVYIALLNAKSSLKNKLSFVPRSVVIDYDEKRGNFVWVTFLGKNSYGAEGEENYYYPFNPNKTKVEPKVDPNKIDYNNDPNKIVYGYKRMIMGKMKIKAKGHFIFGKNYLVSILDATKFNQKVETVQILKKVYDNNNWTASGEIISNGIKYVWEYSYDSNDTKYKTDGGVLTLKSNENIIKYPLFKIQ